MATLALELPASLAHTSLLAVFAKETKYEFLKLLRTRTFSLSMIGFPVMFYMLFGLSNRGATMDGMDVAKYMLAGYCCFGMIGASLFGIGVGLASERSAGWLELKRASPMPPMAYLLAKCITAQAFGLIIVAILSTLGVLFGGVHLSPKELALMLGMTLAGTVPFAAMGLLLALVVPASAASGVVNLIYLPLSFMSGLWIPLQHLPKFLQADCAVPAGVSPVAADADDLPLSAARLQRRDALAGLAGFTLLMLGASWAVFHRAEQDA